MAAIRVSQGRYKDPKTGRVFNALTQAAADKMIGAARGQNKGRAPVTSPEVAASVGPTLTKQAPPEVQDNMKKALDVEGDALDKATSVLGSVGPVDPANIDPSFTDYENRVSDSVFRHLTKNFARDKAAEREQLEQTLYNRGIPLDANDAQYKSQMTMFDEGWDSRENDAMDRASILAGQRATNQFDMARGANESNLATLGALRDQSATGVATGADLAFKNLAENKRQANQNAALQKQQLANQRLQISKSGAQPQQEDTGFDTN